MYLYEVKFEVEDKNFEPTKPDKNGIRTVSESLYQSEYIVASTFKEVYEKVIQQDNETFELVSIKKLVSIISIIDPA